MEYERPQFARLSRYADEADRDVIDTVSGNPDWEPPAALRDGLRASADGDPESFQYPPSEGLDALRAEIATRRNVPRERVIVTNGAGEANHLALAAALTEADGDEVLLTDPVYPYYPAKTELLGGTPRLLPTEPDGSLDLSRFRAAAGDDTTAILLNSPNNPTGAVYPPETIKATAELADDVGATLIVDEVYDHFDYTGRFESALTLDRDDVVVTTAFSKSMAITGLRVGYAVLPEPLLSHARTRHMLVNVTTSRPAQAAVLRALRETEPGYYAHNRELLRDRIGAFADALDDAGAEYTTPEGAFYVLARFDDFPGTTENAERLIDEAGVAAMPGATFGDARADWFRFALVTPRATEAAERLAAFF
ncbi:pyridoxal phosphate-dependent aminotransferase [Halobaculum sp. MBLA0143]|uniref:pyridoxal phosphate-dependent aminotransferase n=1 Tax=Halobaculum sp. MBLA0143 TaxID=3079933 RepID=UPI003523BAE5